MSSSGPQEPFNETQTAGVLQEVPYLLEVEGGWARNFPA